MTSDFCSNPVSRLPLAREILLHWEIFLPSEYSKKLANMFKEQFNYCTRNCPELIWIEPKNITLEGNFCLMITFSSCRCNSVLAFKSKNY
jgi:hypothetical protein